ncbi:MAG: hypothetical protein ACLGH8_18765 [Bacteroidia bacterium]
MKKIVLFFVGAVLLTLTGCKKHFEGNDYSRLNGYWEIEKVLMPDGSEKDYSINPTVDYFEVKGVKGFRKKAMPQIDGTFRANDFSEAFTIVKEGDKTVLKYVTDYAKWDEELLTADEEQLVTKNQHNIEYHYKKSGRISLE